MLPIIIWSPYVCRVETPHRCPKCCMEHSKVIAVGWTTGGNGNSPRLIHCVNTNVYVCSVQHYVLGHHPDMHSEFPSLRLHC